MNYTKHYTILIDRARQRQLIDSCKEQHHIIPKCMGGSDSSENLVYLTPEEHYVAHQLLVKIHPNEDGLVYAALMMCVGHSRNNKKYGWLKRRYHVICKQRIGDKNGAFGSKWISNPDTGLSKKISIMESVPLGFVFGRNITWKICEVCGTKHLTTFSRVCSRECSDSITRKKISDELANSLLFDYENGMSMKDILHKYNRKSEQSVSTFLRKRFPNRKTFLPKKRVNISQV